MLRLLLLTLILANGLYFAWSQGLLRAYGFAPTQQSEPHRLEQQINPDALHVLNAGELKSAQEQTQAAQTPAQCLVAGPFNDVQASALRASLEANLPTGMWQFGSVQIPERWIVYMGRYTDAATLQKKQSELNAMHLQVDEVHAPALVMGLSLGAFDSKDKADEALMVLSKRGIRTARVVQERAQSSATELRLPAATEALRKRLEELAPPLAGKALRRCETPNGVSN
jgi:hypothetical protein